MGANKESRKEEGVKILLGYKVLRNDNNESNIGYFLIGSRTVYKLLRHDNRPEYMFAVNSKGRICCIKGTSTFTDQGGALRPAVLSGRIS